MLEVAQARLDEGEAKVPVELAVVDGQDIPEDESFDILYLHVLWHSTCLNANARCRKCIAVLFMRAGIFTLPNPLMRLGYRIYLRWGIPAWGKLVTDDASGFVYLAKSIKAFPDQEGFTKMLKDAGFSRVEYTNVTFG